MAFLHTHSCECVKSELDLFTLPPTQTSVESCYWADYKPIASMTEESPIEFIVPSNTEEYLDLAHTMLSVKVSMVYVAGLSDNRLAEIKEKNTNAGPVNNLLHSLFSQVDIYFNQKLVTQPNNFYPYRAYIENCLNYGMDAKDTLLSCVGWADDTAGYFNSFKGENKGLTARRNMFNDKGSIDLIGHIHADVCNQNKLLLNGVDVRMRLVKSRKGFAIMDDTDVIDFVIQEASLHVRRVKVNPGVLVAHAQTLAKTTAKYALSRVEIKAIVLSKGIFGDTVENVILGTLPKRIIIFFVSNRAFHGDRKLNPFNFENFGLNYLCLYVDGKQIPSKPLQPNYSEDSHSFVEAYNTLFTGTGIHFQRGTHTISRDYYDKGYCMYAFDLTPDLSANELHWNLVRHGNVRLEFRFAQALAETINCMVYAEHDSVLEIDQTRQCFLDYSG